MRHSVAPGRASQAHGHSTATTLKFIEKKKEADAVMALERASSMFLKQMESIADDCEIMGDASQIHGQVLEQWPRMFQILSMFLQQREQSAIRDTNELDNDVSKNDGQRLVRIPVEELMAASAE